MSGFNGAAQGLLFEEWIECHDPSLDECSPRNQDRIGEAGALLVRADLLRNGINCTESPKGLMHDIMTVDSPISKLQVKAQSEPRLSNKQSRIPVYRFQPNGNGGFDRYTEKDVDAIALVALDKFIILYVLPNELPSYPHLNPIHFTKEKWEMSRKRVFGK